MAMLLPFRDTGRAGQATTPGSHMDLVHVPDGDLKAMRLAE